MLAQVLLPRESGERRLSHSHEQKAERGEQNKKHQIDKGKETKIRPHLCRVLFRIGAKGDKARKRGNQCPRPPDIDPEEQGAVIVGKAGEEDRARHIADHLTGENAEQKRAFFKQGEKQISDRLDADAVRAKIDLCFVKGYLEGYIRDGDTLRRPNPEGELHSVVCPACAARFEFRGESGKCPWCGTVTLADDGKK